MKNDLVLVLFWPLQFNSVNLTMKYRRALQLYYSQCINVSCSSERVSSRDTRYLNGLLPRGDRNLRWLSSCGDRGTWHSADILIKNRSRSATVPHLHDVMSWINNISLRTRVVDAMMVRCWACRIRRRPNIVPSLGQRLVFVCIQLLPCRRFREVARSFLRCKEKRYPQQCLLLTRTR